MPRKSTVVKVEEEQIIEKSPKQKVKSGPGRPKGSVTKTKKTTVKKITQDVSSGKSTTRKTATKKPIATAATKTRKKRRSFPRDLTGQMFGKWEVLAKYPKNDSSRSKWIVECTCGQIAAVRRDNLVSGRSTQCRACVLAERKVKSIKVG